MNEACFFVFADPDINECESMPCVNGGVCEDKVNNYTCTCTANFTGSRCETGESFLIRPFWILLLKAALFLLSVCQTLSIFQPLFLFLFAMGKMFHDWKWSFTQPDLLSLFSPFLHCNIFPSGTDTQCPKLKFWINGEDELGWLQHLAVCLNHWPHVFAKSICSIF